VGLNLVKIIDNQFTQNEIDAIHQECLSIPCTWAAAKGKSSWKFWSGHLVSVRSNLNIISKYPRIENVWFKLNKFLSDEYECLNVYINCQSLGNESPLHCDDGDITILYYTNPNWKIEWDGGTSFYNIDKTDCIGSVSYKAGRMVLYDSETPHKPQAISIQADDLRVILVFKLTRKYK
jgi:hypothetical protein